MKRWIVLAVLGASLLATSQAAASPSDASAGATASGGAAKRGNAFRIAFKVITNNNGKPVKVKKFTYGKLQTPANDPSDDVPLTCDEGNPVTSLNGYLPAMKVTSGEFKGRFGLDTDGNPNTAEAQVKVTGEFKNHNHRVDGTIRITGDFPPTYHNCDSTKLDWTAT